MRLKYVQPAFGGCVFYCFANIFNDESILRNMKFGATHMDSRKIVEKYLPENSLIHIALHTQEMFPITSFTFPKPVNENEICCYTITVAGKNLDATHYIFALLDSENKMIVFDPYNESGIQIEPQELFSRYAVYEIEAICDLTGTGYFVFYKEAFEHLGI